MKIKRGSSSVRRLIFIANSASSSGEGLANLAYDTAGLTWYYFAGDLSNDVQVTLASAVLGTFTSGGFIAVDNTNMPGWYEIGIPDAALDGGNECAMQLYGAANMVPVNIYIELDTVDYQTAAFGANTTAPDNDGIADILTRLPDAPPGAEDGLPVLNADNKVSAVLDTTVLNSVSDSILKRNVSNVEATADEHTLATAILSLLEWSISGGDLIIKRTDGTTTHYTKTLSSATGTGDVITGLN